MHWTPAAAPAVAAVITEPPVEARTGCTLKRNETALHGPARSQEWRVLSGGLVVVSTASEEDDHALAIVIPIDAEWQIRLKSADQVRGVLMGKRSKRWFTRQRQTRIAQALRTHDAQQYGATLRDIATVYFGQSRVAAEHWKTSALKAQTARLVAYGRRLTISGYRQLLRGRTASRR